MRRFVVLPVAAFVLAACTESRELVAPDDLRPEFASAQFTTSGAKKPTIAIQDNGALFVTFKISGLGANVNVDVTVTGDATLVESCVNGGDNIPSDAKKTSTTVRVNHTERFSSDKNGNVEASITVPVPAGTLRCPPGQTATLISVTYRNVSLSFRSEFDQTGVFAFAGTFSKTF
jgi:hypothetical protein